MNRIGLYAATVMVAVLLVAGCQVRRQAAPVGVALLRVAKVMRATDRPALSPIAWAADGRRFAYGTRDGVWVHGLGDTRGARIAPGGAVTAVAWSVPADVIAYVDRGALHTVRPDGRELRPIPVKGVAALPVWAPGGDRLAVAVYPQGGGMPQLWLTSPSGAMLRQVSWVPRGRGITSFGWYPDALYLFVGVAVHEREDVTEWWRVRINYPDHRRLAGPQQAARESVLAPSGGWIGFVAPEGGGERAYVVRADGGNPRAVSPRVRRVGGLGWSPHSDKIALGLLLGESEAEVRVAAAARTADLLVTAYRPEFPDPGAGISVAWSPDEAYLAYGTNTGSMMGPVWLARFAPR